MKTRALLLCIAFSSFSAAAQERPKNAPPAPQPAQAVAPQSSTETFDSWVLHCQKMPSAPPSNAASKMCEVVSTVVDGRDRQVLRIAIGLRPQDKGKRAVVVQLPVNVRVGKPIQLVSEGSDRTFAFAYQACAPVGCFAETERQDELIQWMSANAGARMRLEFSDAQGSAVAVPLVAQGFAAAWSAFQAEAAKNK